MADVFEIEIATPQRLLAREKVIRAQIPAKDGYIGVLPDHAALLSELGIGAMTYTTPDDHRFSLAVGGGMKGIAATYTPLVFNVLDGWWRIGVLAAVWISAVAGVAGAAPFLRIPRQVLAALYLAMGWVAVIAIVPLTAALGWVAAVLIALGGVQYSLGAAAYAFKKPRLWPRVFGYHELFHLAVITASVTFYVVVVHYAVPFHRAG